MKINKIKAKIQFITILKKKLITFNPTGSITLRIFLRFRLRKINFQIQMRTPQIPSLNKRIISRSRKIAREPKIKQKEDEAMKSKIQVRSQINKIDAEPKATLCIWTILRFVKLCTKIQMKNQSHKICQKAGKRSHSQWYKKDISKRRKISKTTFINWISINKISRSSRNTNNSRKHIKSQMHHTETL